MNNIESSTGEIVMYQPDETIRLEVRMGEETVWLSQAQMAELFGTKRQAITKHLQNIYESDELKKEATSSILELVRREGNRTVKRKVEFYNLDAIISVGFRVNKKANVIKKAMCIFCTFQIPTNLLCTISTPSTPVNYQVSNSLTSSDIISSTNPSPSISASEIMIGS